MNTGSGYLYQSRGNLILDIFLSLTACLMNIAVIDRKNDTMAPNTRSCIINFSPPFTL